MQTAEKKPKESDILSLEVCEARLRSLGLSADHVQKLGDTIDAIGDTLLDTYFSQFYE